jgi:DNA-binding PadR family transcriptional regulator
VDVRQAQYIVRDMAKQGLIERCATVATGRRPRNVYRAATSRQAGHEALARLMFHAWA